MIRALGRLWCWIAHEDAHVHRTEGNWLRVRDCDVCGRRWARKLTAEELSP